MKTRQTGQIIAPPPLTVAKGFTEAFKSALEEMCEEKPRRKGVHRVNKVKSGRVEKKHTRASTTLPAKTINKRMTTRSAATINQQDASVASAAPTKKQDSTSHLKEREVIATRSRAKSDQATNKSSAEPKIAVPQRASKRHATANPHAPVVVEKPVKPRTTRSASLQKHTNSTVISTKTTTQDENATGSVTGKFGNRDKKFTKRNPGQFREVKSGRVTKRTYFKFKAKAAMNKKQPLQQKSTSYSEAEIKSRLSQILVQATQSDPGFENELNSLSDNDLQLKRNLDKVQQAVKECNTLINDLKKRDQTEIIKESLSTSQSTLIMLMNLELNLKDERAQLVEPIKSLTGKLSTLSGVAINDPAIRLFEKAHFV